MQTSMCIGEISKHPVTAVTPKKTEHASQYTNTILRKNPRPGGNGSRRAAERAENALFSDHPETLVHLEDLTVDTPG